MDSKVNESQNKGLQDLGNTLFHNSVKDWKTQVEQLFVLAKREKASIISLYGRISSTHEIDIIEILIEIANKRLDQKVLFHFSQSESLELIVEKYKGKPIINYLSSEDWMLEKILPILAKRPMSIVLQTIGDGGIPTTVERRLRLIKKTFDKLEDIGYRKEDVFIDTLSPSSTLLPKVVEVGLETIKQLQTLGYKTILWPANVALGERNLQEIASNYIKTACENGLDFAVVDSDHSKIIKTINETNKNRGK